ncbi:hypothetical protein CHINAEXTREME_19260 [Halobiforma lacisalsi AJ5]|uniref:DUF8119 domain-containing protein n=1 Tax=Natronobacterium lacisalsi AJ5 TaxID=358396 RepID=M0LRE4_NATLA|nr:hypothetical protein [Halobiforma lacisalsi]APW99776.1 hypothetical protein CHINAEXTREME_19260 [Halobiforma lacisalsi AJ5]EMA36046.1 hypothetical protein C445_04293 [Halobiforma lacisalsi AJ5]
MTTEDERRPRPDDDRTSRGRLRAVTSAGLRVLADLLILSLWVLALTLAFLAFGWPRWAFYGTLLLGVGVYVSITSGWWESAAADGGA